MPPAPISKAVTSAPEPVALVSQTAFSPLRATARLLDWWGRELASLLPIATSGAEIGNELWIVLSIEESGARLLEQRGGRIQVLAGDTTAGDSENEIDEALERMSRDQRGARYCIRFAHALCFERKVDLPVAASRDIARILALDLERSLPFRAQDIFAAHLLEPPAAAGDRVSARQLIVKRSLVEQASGRLAKHGMEADRVDCWASDGVTPLPLDFLAGLSTSRQEPKSHALIWMAALTIVLAGTATVFEVHRQQTALASLQEVTTQLRQQAQALRQEHQRLESQLAAYSVVIKLRQMETSKLDLLDELTRLLPDSDHLVDLRIDGDVIEAAADLGARRWQAFVDVTLPLSVPGIIGGCLLVFIPAVGEFTIPALLGGADTLMIGRVLWDEFFSNNDWPMASTVAVVMILLILVPLAIFNRYQAQAQEARR